jgi:hypothetical protein
MTLRGAVVTVSREALTQNRVPMGARDGGYEGRDCVGRGAAVAAPARPGDLCLEAAAGHPAIYVGEG